MIIRQKLEQLYLEEWWFDHGLLSAVLRELKSLAVKHKAVRVYAFEIPSADPEGETGGPDPPGKSQVIWVSIGNKQFDTPGKRWTPLPPWKNVGPPLEHRFL